MELSTDSRPLVSYFGFAVGTPVYLRNVGVNDRVSLQSMADVLERDAMPPHLAACQGDRFEDRFVDVQVSLPRRDLVDEGANAADDSGGLIACLDDKIECTSDLLEVRWLGGKPA